jgi:hypothetical protein
MRPEEENVYHRVTAVWLLFITCHLVLILPLGVATAPAYRPGQCSNIDPALQAMLASNYGVSLPSLLSLQPSFRWVSRDVLRCFFSKAHPKSSIVRP